MSELKKLTEENLTQQPEEVFDIWCKLGQGSYGSVYQAIHKETKQVLAIKQVPVDTDVKEIIKEVSIMQQCDSPYVVKYYGSYFKNTDLWIVMEYCGAGSVLDIMKLRGVYWNLPKGKGKTLTEDEIATVLSDTLKGLEYLHLRKKIHRDIKAGNILLTLEGHAKLADFGVAGQLTDTMAKRNTVIGTPYWMAPEIIQEVGHDCVADIWSLGITALEMAEGKAPYADIHPMRAIFMIPDKPPPTFSQPDLWSSGFIDFVSLCLVKNPDSRATASKLLQNDFITNAKAPMILTTMIQEAQDSKERLKTEQSSTDCDSISGTMVSGDLGTLVNHDVPDGTMIQHGTSTNGKSDQIESKVMNGIESNLGTMVINEENPNENKNLEASANEYRPEYLDHFDKKDKNTEAPIDKVETKEEMINEEETYVNISPSKLPSKSNETNDFLSLQDQDLKAKLKFISTSQLMDQMSNLDKNMELEIDDLRRKYHAKLQPIRDAIDQKRKQQQNF